MLQKFTSLPIHSLDLNSKSPSLYSESYRFCQFCGSKITYNMKFCPFCRANQKKERFSSPIISKSSSTWRFIENKKRFIRLVAFFASLLSLVILTFVGSQASLTQEEATLIVEALQESFPPNITYTQIALNNMFICLLFFTPFFGSLLLIQVSYNLGITLLALSLFFNVNSNDLFLSLFFYPWTWFEFVAYSLASVQSIMLLLALFQRNLRNEIKQSLISIAICLILIIFGAVIEVANMT